MLVILVIILLVVYWDQVMNMACSAKDKFTEWQGRDVGPKPHSTILLYPEPNFKGTPIVYGDSTKTMGWVPFARRKELGFCWGIGSIKVIHDGKKVPADMPHRVRLVSWTGGLRTRNQPCDGYTYPYTVTDSGVGGPSEPDTPPADLPFQRSQNPYPNYFDTSIGPDGTQNGSIQEIMMINGINDLTALAGDPDMAGPNGLQMGNYWDNLYAQTFYLRIESAGLAVPAKK